VGVLRPQFWWWWRVQIYPDFGPMVTDLPDDVTQDNSSTFKDNLNE
jgi:hypothetical protein